MVCTQAVRNFFFSSRRRHTRFAKGHTSRGPSKDGPGEINIPISCAGMAIMPGDLIVGDADGVIAIPQAEANDVLARTQAHLEKEARSEEHTSELQSLMRISYAVLCLKKKNNKTTHNTE